MVPEGDIVKQAAQDRRRVSATYKSAEELVAACLIKAGLIKAGMVKKFGIDTEIWNRYR